MDDPRFVPSEDRTDIMVEDKVEVNVLARYYPFSHYKVRCCSLACLLACLLACAPPLPVRPFSWSLTG